MENPRSEVNKEITWADSAANVSYVKPMTATDPGEGQAKEEKRNTHLKSEKSSLTAVLGHRSPSDIGCLVLIVIIVVVPLTIFTKDIILCRPTDVPGGSNLLPTSAITTTQALQPSIVLIGTAFNGDVYYFDSPNGVFYHDAVSGGSVAVAKFPDYETLHWSPKREQVAFVIQDRTDALPRLYAVNLSSPPSDRNPHLVTQRDANGFPAEFGLRADSPVAWSQDEHYIAFVAYDQAERAALFVTNVPTGTVRRLTEGLEPVTSVAWETCTDTQGIVDERIVYVLLRDGKEFTYSIEENGANNNPWER